MNTKLTPATLNALRAVAAGERPHPTAALRASELGLLRCINPIKVPGRPYSYRLTGKGRRALEADHANLD